MICCTLYMSPVGELKLASDGRALTGLWIDGQKYHGDCLYPHMERRDDIPVFAAARGWLDRYFSGGRPEPGELPLAPAGSAFRRAVWDRLCRIPWGQTVTYGQLADELSGAQPGRRIPAQAVGGAVAHNPVSIIIPCHRVVGRDGSLTGYAGGLDIKARLLTLEGADMAALHMPRGRG